MEIHLWKAVCVVCALLLNATGSFSQLDVCGRPQLNTKIVGGEDAAPGSWPWQVSFQDNGTHFCGGSLINRNWILSAAHCFQKCIESNTTAKIAVYLGIEWLNGNNINMQSIIINNINNHPKYNNVTGDNDIALVQLSSAVNFSNYVLPVCLAAKDSSSLVGTNVWVTGWGRIGSNVSLPSSKPLQEVQMPIVSNSDCALVYDLITDNMICAGRAQGGKDSCQGDSGGPMVLKQNKTWVQAGMVIFGSIDGCALPNVPGVYIRVSQYQDWINSLINTSQPGFVTVSIGNHSFLTLFCLLLSFFIMHFLGSLTIFY